MQAQHTTGFPSLSTLVAITSTMVAAALGFALVAAVDRPAASIAPAALSLHGVGAEQVAQDRSEGGFSVSTSIGGEHIAHDRSEGW